jgi:Ca2+-binding EF-hand superfamily protein
MGTSQTKYVLTANVYSNIPQLSKHRKDFDALGVAESNVGQIHSVFSLVDVDSSSEISLDEFLLFLSTEKTPFAQSIFQAFDKDNNKKIDPFEFVISVWNFCTLSSENIAKFVFELYDKDDRCDLKVILFF